MHIHQKLYLNNREVLKHVQYVLLLMLDDVCRRREQRDFQIVISIIDH